MADLKLVNATQLDSDLESLADVIREKASLGEETPLTFPEGMKEVISNFNIEQLNIKSIDVPQSYAIGNTWRRSKEERG